MLGQWDMSPSFPFFFTLAMLGWQVSSRCLWLVVREENNAVPLTPPLPLGFWANLGNEVTALIDWLRVLLSHFPDAIPCLYSVIFWEGLLALKTMV